MRYLTLTKGIYSPQCTLEKRIAIRPTVSSCSSELFIMGADCWRVLRNCAGVVAAGLLLLTVSKPGALAATSFDECKTLPRGAKSDTVELMDNGDSSDCLTIEHPIRLSGQTFRRETRLRFICNGGQCPEFVCHSCTFEGLLRLDYSKSRERGRLDLDESTIAGLK